MRKIGVGRPLLCEMKKDGGVEPADEEDQHRRLPPPVTFQGRLRRPLRERRGLCQISQCVNVWGRRLAYAKPPLSAIIPHGHCSADVRSEGRTP